MLMDIRSSHKAAAADHIRLLETANRAESGQLQFWSEPSEILNLRSSNTPETVDLNIP